MFIRHNPSRNWKHLLLASILLLGINAGAFADGNLYQTLLQSSAMIVAGDRVGSGALVDAERRVFLTKYHVVGENDEVKVVFPQLDDDGQLLTNRREVMSRLDEISVSGRVVARDARRDLALVEIDTIPAGRVEIPIAAQSISPGERVHSIGNPGVSSAMWVYTTGMVRQVYEKTYELANSQVIDARVVETDAPINQGDSGGPVVNDNQELVAIVSATSTKGSLVSVCIDISELKTFLDGDNSTIDLPIKTMLDELGYTYELKSNGDFFVDVTTTEQRTIRVEIDADIQVYNGRRLRHIRSLLTTFENEDVPEWLLRKLMIENGNRKFGNWEVWNGDAKQFVIYRSDVNLEADPSEVKAMLHGVATVTQAMIDQLVNQGSNEGKETGDQETGPSLDTLVGTWVGKQSTNGRDLAYAVSLQADGSYHWYVTDGEKALLDNRGSFSLEGDRINFKDRQESFSATIKLIDSDKLVYESKILKIEMNRYQEKEEQPQLTGTWSAVVKLADGTMARYTLNLENGRLLWTVNQGQGQPVVIEASYSISGNTLTYSTGGSSFTAELSLVDNQTLVYKDQNNALTLKRT